MAAEQRSFDAVPGQAPRVEHPHEAARSRLAEEPERIAAEPVAMRDHDGAHGRSRDRGFDHVAALDQDVAPGARGGGVRRHEGCDGEGLGVVHDGGPATKEDAVLRAFLPRRAAAQPSL